MNASQLILQDSGNFEWYSPPEIVDRARRAMGRIELDPFSSLVANERIKAERIFTIEDDGLKQEWVTPAAFGNHPFGRKLNPVCVKKMVHEYTVGRMKQGCFITFASTSEGWFQPLMAYPQCYPRKRTNFYLPNGEKKRGVTKGSCITFFGPNVEAFAREFRDLGTIKVQFT